jgi:Ca2+-binding RTX toxin-like protein
MIFVQREGTTGTVRFSGDAARVLDSGGKVVADWTTGGSISGIPQGEGYRLEIRTGSNVVLDDLVVGAVVFIMGQSNIQRWYDPPPEGRAGGGLYEMNSSGSIGTVDGGAAQHFGRGYAEALGAPVLLVAGARGGTSLLASEDKGNGYWLDTAPGSLYATMLARLADVGGRAELVLWGQGETDASGGASTSEYAAGLTTFMNRVLADFEPDRVLIQEIGPRGSGDGRYDGVRSAQYQVAGAIGPVDIGAVTTDLNTLADGIHLSGASRTLAADRMLVSALAVEGINIARAVWTGSSGGDSRTAGGGRDELRGQDGNDTLDGGDGSDVILGQGGNDELRGGGGLDIMRGDAGNDVVDGGAGDDVLSGGDGFDTLRGGEGNDEIWADAGDDRIEGGGGNDLIWGEGGNDTAVFSGPRSGYTVSVSGGTTTVTDIDFSNGNEGRDTLFGVENLEFGGIAAPPGGGTLPPLFTGTADYADFATITAGTYDPNSLYNALGGNDEVYLPVDAAAATAVGYDRLRAFDAGDGDDIVIGGSLADTIRGGAGADILNGGANADRMDGGTGDDTYYVDNSGDIVFERPGEGTDTVISNSSLSLKSNIENLTLSGTSSTSGTGNDLDNVITGNSGGNKLSGGGGADLLRGLGGNDTLDGGAGTDTLEGGAGNDRYVLSDASDVVIEGAADGSADMVQAGFSFTLAANLERGSLLGTAGASITGNGLNNRLDGNAGGNSLEGLGGNDTIYGLAGSDTLRGGEGNDTLEGGEGVDTLEGGAGNDRFVFRSLAEVDGDTILDFVRGDRIDVSRLDAIAGTSTNDTFAFRGTSGITGAGQLGFAQDAGAGVTRVFGHTNADGVADFTLTANGLITFVASDFAL